MSDSTGLKKALVVEESKIIADMLAFILKHHGYDVIVASDGLEAQKLIDVIPTPSIILLEIMLPQFDGFQVLKMIRAKKGWGEVPIIMLTTSKNNRDRDRAYRAGATEFISKPFSLQRVISTINGMTGQA